MDKQQQDAIALRQAQNDITRALQRLEQETGRNVRGVAVIEYQFVGEASRRAATVDLSPPPGNDWLTT